MTLIKSISGIRGTIGGFQGENLTPIDAVKYAAAYGSWVKQQREKNNYTVVVGRDARISGNMMQQLVMNTLIGLGIHVVDLDLSTTPTVEVAVMLEHADGGIILTASHNPKQWNALKLLNHKGEFLDAKEGQKILDIAENDNINFSEVDDLGKITSNQAYIDLHIDEILDLSLVDVEAIKKAKFKVVVDGVNSTGGIAVPALLEALGVEPVKLYCEPTGEFPHNPEPLQEHLGDLMNRVVDEHADFGIVVDPDVDRLAFVDENGGMFGEEYTLVAVADYVLRHTPGNTVSNMSSSRALRDITEKRNGKYTASAVGEVNVVVKMKETNAVIGGEGNGGIIYPELHYGRDSLVGIALFLSYLADLRISVSALRKTYTSYFMSKKKIQLTPQLDVDKLLKAMELKYADEEINNIDGVKIDFDDNWVHLRKSNTEPIIRIYTEAKSQEEADLLADKIIGEIKLIANL
ncbi:phosphoglucosamine mutase [Flavobacteriaceae bacterium]|jgi:phosphomannomutase|uniref:Phosphoglucomutase/phosphomannomutase family protein n=1 Tax=uncultured Flavobacteriia bacterium TaxID=212695 RepID=H6RFR9_9BACT|nr:phosphomannomutase / phosphoglucosamine mutase [uncultured bacterium]MDB9913386.1 phosphoglucosamine mutase [Flavobacteriaceae bacterium]MDB9993594.1 phosphoglucosamine mutase [Flavobacteriaceae bacterium]CCF99880.1 phosphoglucomutase/phosphomannomutase family protein [uncultured Flavobacteriia bacterium]